MARRPTTARAPLSCRSISNAESVIVSSEEKAHEVVDDEDACRARDDRGVHRAADAGGAARDREAEVAARKTDHDPEDDALDEAVHHVADAQKAGHQTVVEGH